MRKCSKCKKIKPIAEFNKRDKNRIRSECRVCYNLYKKEFYLKNKLKELNRWKNQRRISIDRNRKFVKQYLLKHPCIDCKEKNLIVLQFDHCRGKKKANISKMVRYSSLENLKKEIEKCDVRCANCHTKKTAERAGWHNIYEID